MTVKLAVCLVIYFGALLCQSSALDARWDQEWTKFIKTHRKVYKNRSEELYR